MGPAAELDKIRPELSGGMSGIVTQCIVELEMKVHKVFRIYAKTDLPYYLTTIYHNLKYESPSRHFQLGECPSWGFLCECENFAKVRFQL